MALGRGGSKGGVAVTRPSASRRIPLDLPFERVVCPRKGEEV